MSNELQTVSTFCKLEKTSLTFKREVTKEEWSQVFSGLKTIEGCVQFWIGDCLKYREQKWGMYEDISEESGYAQETLEKFKETAERVKEGTRVPELGYRHHQEVAFLEDNKQKEFLNKAVENKWSVKELKNAIKEDKFNTLPKVELPKGKFNVIYVDPPWDVQAGPGWGSGGESRDLIYPTMTIEEITALPVGELANNNSHLYVWTINKYIPETYEIIKAWGFEPSCLLTWVKPPHGIGLGGTFVQTTEHLLFCRKGSLEANKRIDTSWFSYPRTRHSEKPKEIRKMIEEVSPGSRIELFARTKTEGWEVWGNEV